MGLEKEVKPRIVPARARSPDPRSPTATGELGYESTLMYGRYTSDLGQFAKRESRRVKRIEKQRRKEEKLLKQELRDEKANKYTKAGRKVGSFVWHHTCARFGEDWVFIAILGVLMALISFTMDWGIAILNRARIWLYLDLDYHVSVQYFAWIILPVTLVLFSAGFVHLIAPQAIGSGIPEMKTILRGVTLKEYLTGKTLFAKCVGLTASLGSGMPLGKEGPFVHIASIIAALLSKVRSFKGIYENESRSNEMLSAACAVGIACAFAAPVGGVLFSIEVTSVYFAVRNYWSGFFASGFGAMFFRLLAVWFQGMDTIQPLFKTNFEGAFPYDPLELIVFSIIGVLAGLIGALYVWVHRKYVLWMRGNKTLNSYLQKNRFLYPAVISWFIATMNFPLGFGQFIAGGLTTHGHIMSLFSNFPWSKDNFTVEEVQILKHWVTPYTGHFLNMFIFIVFTFILSIMASTLAIPSGIFVPVFKIGAALGRIVGETMYVVFPQGIWFSGEQWPITPGGYAVVGAAAVSGCVTGTISNAVIITEMTGQITHIIPTLIAVIIANGIHRWLQPSIFDSISAIKKLPNLPDFHSGSGGAYNVTVKDFMLRGVKFIWHGMSYRNLKEILKENRHLKAFPLVDNPESMVLLGSINRHHLAKSIERHIGRERRIQAAARRKKEEEALAKAKEDMERLQFVQEKARRPSRFEVVPVHSVTVTPEPTPIEDKPSGSMSLLNQPMKSILKKPNSFHLFHFGQSPSPFSPYNTVTGVGSESRVRNAFHAIFQKSTTLQDAQTGGDSGDLNITQSKGGSFSLLPLKKAVQLPVERVIDMSPEEQKMWEEDAMDEPVDFERCIVDAAPFQLVATTTLVKVHSIFNLLGIRSAYVTATGRLTGVVGMSELRQAIEQCSAGTFRRPSVAAAAEKEKDPVPPPSRVRDLESPDPDSEVENGWSDSGGESRERLNSSLDNVQKPRGKTI